MKTKQFKIAGEVVSGEIYAEFCELYGKQQVDERRVKKLEEELLNFKLELQTFIIVHEPWKNLEIDGESLMDFGISMGVGVKEQYSKEKHGEYLCESYDIQEGDEISWFDPEMLTKGK